MIFTRATNVEIMRWPLEARHAYVQAVTEIRILTAAKSRQVEKNVGLASTLIDVQREKLAAEAALADARAAVLAECWWCGEPEADPVHAGRAVERAGSDGMGNYLDRAHEYLALKDSARKLTTMDAHGNRSLRLND